MRDFSLIFLYILPIDKTATLWYNGAAPTSVERRNFNYTTRHKICQELNCTKSIQKKSRFLCNLPIAIWAKSDIINNVRRE